ncbi:unnamed protein product [Pedinophyceae sp. YPF-701]|nr:unnamed protein product [Pedinophyceae sp. YPF-701]
MSGTTRSMHAGSMREEEWSTTRSRIVGLTTPFARCSVGIGLLKGEDKHYARVCTEWPSESSGGRGTFRTTPVFMARRTMMLTDIGRIEAECGEADEVNFVDARERPWHALEGANGEPQHVAMDDKSYGLYCVMDGHNGHECAQFCMSQVHKEVHKRLPPGPWPLHDDAAATAWLAELRAALCNALAVIERKFGAAGIPSGCTVTLVLVTGWLATVASLGDTLAYLDTGSEVVPVTADHRLDVSEREVKRVRAHEGRGVLVRRLCTSLRGAAEEFEGGVGPLRVWPGGLALGRALGDFDVGEAVICTPTVHQVRLPEAGCRLVVATDGLWDADKTVGNAEMVQEVRMRPSDTAAKLLVRRAGKTYGLADDVTVMVVDIVPKAAQVRSSADDFAQLVAGFGRENPVEAWHKPKGPKGLLLACLGGRRNNNNNKSANSSHGPKEPSAPGSPAAKDVRKARSERIDRAAADPATPASARDVLAMPDTTRECPSVGVSSPCGMDDAAMEDEASEPLFLAPGAAGDSARDPRVSVDKPWRWGWLSVVDLAGVEEHAGGGEAWPHPLDREMHEHLAAFQAVSKEVWQDSVAARRGNKDPFTEPGIVARCSGL